MENEQIESHDESNVRLVTRKELLIQYHNAHLRQLVAQVINLKAFEKSNDTDVFAIVPVNGPGGQGSRKITVKEQKSVTVKAIEQQVLLMSVMEELLKQEGQEVPVDANIAEYADAIVPKDKAN